MATSRNHLGLLVAVLLLCCASAANAAAVWTVGPVTDWTANPSNLLYTATISTSSLANLADGKLVEFGNNGNVGNNTVVSWTLSGPSTVYAVNVFTKYSDAGRDGIDVAKLEVKCSGSDEWVDLGADEVEYATLHLDGGNIAHDGHRGSFYAIYKDADNAPLATDVVAFRVTFGPNQDNSKTGYGEIEFVGYSDVGWQLSVTQPASLLGSVAISPSSSDGFYADGTVVTLSVDKTNDVEFIKWTGDVPEADIATTPLALTIDRSRKVSLVLKAPYFVVDGSYITDGWQKYSMTLSGSEISVTGCSSLGSNSVMDASLPVKGGYSIVSIGGFVSSGVKKLILPETIKRLANRAFAACSSLTSVSPMFPDSLTTFGGGCFANAGGFTGNVRIGFGTDSGGNPLPVTFSIHDGTRGLQFQSQALGPDILLGPGVTSIPSYTFRNCSIVTNLSLGANLSSLKANAFEQLGKSANASVVFAGDKPTLEASAFSATTPAKVRFLVPWNGGSKYPAWAAFLTDTAKVTPWANLSAADKETYEANFPGKMATHNPYGKVISSEDGFPAGSWVCATKSSGFAIFVR
jgi:hypothetical protein